METLHFFKITEDSKKYDMVELIYDNMTNNYFVRWKWTSMKEPREKDFYGDKNEAIKYYQGRKEFAKACN